MENQKAYKKKDSYKNLYCKTHGIPIIRISYTHLNSLTLKRFNIKNF